MITKEQAIQGTEFHVGTCRRIVGPRGGITESIKSWRKNGQVQAWKTRPNDFSVPIKRGLYEYSAIFFVETKDGARAVTVPEGNAHLFHLPEDCPLATDEALRKIEAALEPKQP